MPSIADSRIEVSTVTVNAEGDKHEPEEHAVRHILTVDDANVTLGKQATGETMRTAVVVNDIAAHEVATNLKSSCRLCAHWRRDAAAATLRAWAYGDHEQRKQVNRIRFAVGQFGDGGDGESGEAVDDAELFAQMGQCEAMTEIKGTPTLTHWMACCPTERGPKGEDLSKLFRLRDRDSAKQQGAVQDQIMRATGAKEKLMVSGIVMPWAKPEAP